MLLVFLTRQRIWVQHHCHRSFHLTAKTSLNMQIVGCGTGTGGGPHQVGSTIAAAASMSSSAEANNAAGRTSPSGKPLLRGVIFDMDGTLTIPNLDFGEMYARCNVPKNADILQAIADMPIDEAHRARNVVEEMEEEGRRTLQLMPGAVEVGKWLAQHELPYALVTRNNKKTVQHFVDNLWTQEDDTSVGSFSVTLSRDDPADLPHKPDPAALRHIADKWDIDIPSNDLIMVGDSPSNDIVFGKAAGVSTALLDIDGKHAEDARNNNDNAIVADICMEHLWELPNQLWKRFHIESSLGTNQPLLKYPPPQSSNAIAKAAMEGDLDHLKTLSLTDLNTPDNESGNTPLVWASDAGHIKVVEFLIEQGVNLNMQGYLGATAICRASRRGHTEIVELLLTHNADPYISNDKMQYPLHFAAFKLNKDVVDILLKHGANTFVLDRKGRTPAEDTSDTSIREMIMNARPTIPGLS